MNRSKLADVSEIVSSLAIVITLVYLTVEIDQNTNAMRAQSQQAVLEAAQADLYYLASNPEISAALSNTGALSGLDQIKLDAVLTANLRSREFAWLQFQEGAIGEAQWETEQAVLFSIFDSPKSRVWWNNAGRHYFGPTFVAFVDSLLSQSKATGRVWPTAEGWDNPKSGEQEE